MVWLAWQWSSEGIGGRGRARRVEAGAMVDGGEPDAAPVFERTRDFFFFLRNSSEREIPAASELERTLGRKQTSYLNGVQ